MSEKSVNKNVGKVCKKNVGKGVITSDKQRWQHILLVCGKIIVGKQISADNFIGL